MLNSLLFFLPLCEGRHPQGNWVPRRRDCVQSVDIPLSHNNEDTTLSREGQILHCSVLVGHPTDLGSGW